MNAFVASTEFPGSGIATVRALQPAPSRSGIRRYIAGIFALILGGLVADPCPAEPFGSPWIGFNAGESAFPGNPDPTERSPQAIAAADLDGDGDMDVVVANYDYASPGGTSGLSGFAVLENDGQGRYGSPVHYTVSTRGHFDIVVADFDGDDDLDLALPHSGRIGSEIGNTIVLFRNDGTGAFAAAGEFAVQVQPMDLAVGDFDGDGRPDLVAGSSRYTSDKVAVLINDGNGFAPQIALPAGPVPDRVAAGDFDRDGLDDIAVSALGDLSLVMNLGGGAFAPPIVLSPPGGQEPVVGTIVVADLDGDGRLDLIHGVHSSSGPHAGKDLAIRLGNGDGTFAAPVYHDLYLYATTPEGVVPVDLDGDGDLDLAVCDWSGGTGDGIFVLWNDGSGTFAGPQHIPAGEGTQGVVAADVDGDLDADLITADRNSMAITVHENPGDGTFPILDQRHLTGTLTSLHLVLGDVDGDQDLDALVSSESFGTPGAILENDGNGNFTTTALISHSGDYGRGAANAKLLDLDGDGDLDILYNDAHTDDATGYDFWTALNDGTGAFSAPVEWDLNTCGNGDIGAFDLDNDGDLDVVNLEELACVGIPSANRLFIRLNNGDATFQDPYIVEIDTGPHALAGGDFDADGNIDLVTAHWMPYGARDFLNVHLGNGDGTFREEMFYQVGQGPRWIAVGDWNGDARLDLATANSGADGIGRETLTVLLGTGTGHFVDRTDIYAPYSPDLLGATGLTAGDVDADGDLDLLMTTTANCVVLYENDGDGHFSFARRLGIYWGPWSPVHEDVDGDGVRDLVTIVGELPSGNSQSLAVQRGRSLDPSGLETIMPPLAGNDGPSLLEIEPNPFQSETRFALELDRTQSVTVAVFSPAGRRVAVLHQGTLTGGRSHVFELSGRALPSGVYVVHATGESFSAVGKAILRR